MRLAEHVAGSALLLFCFMATKKHLHSSRRTHTDTSTPNSCDTEHISSSHYFGMHTYDHLEWSSPNESHVRHIPPEQRYEKTPLPPRRRMSTL